MWAGISTDIWQVSIVQSPCRARIREVGLGAAGSVPQEFAHPPRAQEQGWQRRAEPSGRWTWTA